MANIDIALQLYTVRESAAKNFSQTLRDVAGIGYRAVELAGYGNLGSVRDVRKSLDDNGIRAISNHVALDRLQKELNRVMDENETLGNHSLVVPYLSEDRRQGVEGWHAVAAALTEIAQAVQKRGFTIAYHNHAYEFQQVDGTRGIDILWEKTDPVLVRSELDTFWARHSGEDPAEYMRRLGPRLLLLHLKDMADDEDPRFAPVGTGVIDFPSILRAASDLGVEWGIVEQDSTYGTPPLEAARTSLENLRQMLAAI